MGGACSTYDRRERCVEDFGGETQGKDHLEDLRVNWKVLKWIFMRWDGERWIALAQDRWKYTDRGKSKCLWKPTLLQLCLP